MSCYMGDAVPGYVTDDRVFIPTSVTHVFDDSEVPVITPDTATPGTGALYAVAALAVVAYMATGG